MGDHGVLVVNPPKPKDPMDALSAGGGGDPMAMMGMMKNQMVFMVLQGLTGYWVSHLFSGFLVAKTPFALTFQFKGMLQRGVDVQALEPGYVSSLCWYMFVMMSSYPIIGLCSAFFWERARRFGQSHDGDDGHNEWWWNDARWWSRHVESLQAGAGRSGDDPARVPLG